MSSNPAKPDETILRRVSTFLCENRDALCALCLVNKSINALASRALYAKVSISSTLDIRLLVQENGGEVVGLHKDTEVLPVKKGYNSLVSSLLPRNAGHVQEFEVKGKLIFTPHELSSAFPLALERAMVKYLNLCSFVWQPAFCDPDLTLTVARLILRLPRTLQRLSMNVPFTLPPLPPPVPKSTAGLDLDVIEEAGKEAEEKDEKDLEQILLEMPPYAPLEDDSDASSTVQKAPPLCIIPPPILTLIQHLTLASPTPEILLSLPENLKSLERPLLSLCLEDNCGSVTPGILISLLPVAHALERFALGVAYSVKYDHLFPFLGELEHLRHLELFHYPQLTTLPTLPKLRALRTLKMTHTYTASRQHVMNMCVWARRLVQSSPLERLEVVCEDAVKWEDAKSDFVLRGPYISYDGLIEHLVCRHAKTLRGLRMRHAFVAARATGRLLERCKQLEEVEVSVRVEVANSLKDLLASAPNLRTIHLTVVNTRSVVSPDPGLLQDGKNRVRCITVNGRGFEGEWTTIWRDGQDPQAVFQLTEVKRS